MPPTVKAANAAALNQLEAMAAFGPPGTGTGLLHGRFALLTISGVTLNVFDWEVEYSQDFADATAHGDFWKQPVPLLQSWTGRCRGYLAATAAATATYIYAASKVSADPAAATFTAYSTPGVTASILFIGTCYASRARIQAPMAMAVQEFELMGIGAPGTGSLP